MTVEASDVAGLVLLLAASIAAGGVNAIAGGGTILTFAVLSAILPPGPGQLLTANVTSKLGLWPGSAAAAWACRHEWPRLPRWALWLVLPSTAGAVAGVVLLQWLPPATFDVIVPWLILMAAVLFAVQPQVARLAARRRQVGGCANAVRPTSCQTLLLAATEEAATDAGFSTRRVERQGGTQPAGMSPKKNPTATSPIETPLPLGEAGRRPGEGASRGCTESLHPHPSPLLHPHPSPLLHPHPSPLLHPHPSPLPEGEGDDRRASPSPGMLAAACGLQFLVGLYGGYFGAGIGILMLAGLAIFSLGDIHAINAVKNLLAAAVNGVATLLIVVAALRGSFEVSWLHVAVAATGSVIGGIAVARLSRRLPATAVRRLVAIVAFALAAYHLSREWPW